MKTLKIPEVAVIRLSVYSRFLAEIKRRGITVTSSEKIGEGAGVSPAQVRKDLAYFGEFGTRGVGYDVEKLHSYILRILNLSMAWNAALVGWGHLGAALTTYKGFRERGFMITGIFDTDPRKIGSEVNGIEILPVEKLAEVVSQNRTKIGIITVPASSAQEIADHLVKSGVQAILNFAPVHLAVPEKIELRNVDLTANLEILTFNIGTQSFRNDSDGFLV